jgi:hypothetical protein
VLGVNNLEPLPGQSQPGLKIKTFQTDPFAPTAILPHQVSDFSSPSLSSFIQPISGRGIRGRDGYPNFVNGINPGREMVAVLKLKQNYRSLDRQKQIAGRISGRKDLHVPGIGGVTNVDRIDQNAGPTVQPGQFPADSIQTIMS